MHLKIYKLIYYVLTILIVVSSIALFIVGDVINVISTKWILSAIVLVLLMATIETSIGIKLDCDQ